MRIGRQVSNLNNNSHESIELECSLPRKRGVIADEDVYVSNKNMISPVELFSNSDSRVPT